MPMTIPLYERDGLDFRPKDGKTSERKFAIIVFVIGRVAPDQYTNNHPVWKTQTTDPLEQKVFL